MRNISIKKFFFIFLIFSLAIFSFLPEIGLAEITPEEIMEAQDKIELKDKDSNAILHSLIQKIADEWINITTSPNFSLEEQAILVILSPSIKTEVGNYLFWELPKEVGKNIIKATIKIASLILSQDPALIIEEIEKFTVEKAKEYAMNWLLQNKIKFNNGNFETSYPDYKKNLQKITLPFIIVYRPLGTNSGEVGIGVYSSEPIRTPIPTVAHPWEGGIEKSYLLLFLG